MFTQFKIPSLYFFIFSFATLFLHQHELQAQLVIQNGAVFATTGNALVTLKDIDLINDGTLSQQQGDGKFIFNGSGNNNIAGSSNPVFDVFEIAKTGSAKILLSQNIQIAGNINFTSGLLDLNNNNILLKPAALLNGETENSHITGSTGGYIEITNNVNAPSAANPGNLGAIFTSSQNFGSTTIRRGHTMQTSTSYGNSIYRHYDITPANNSGLNATLRLKYLDAELNGTSESTIALWKSTDYINWTNMGASNSDMASNYVEQAHINDFSRWTLATSVKPLPVLFESFTVQCNTDKTDVRWQTAQEVGSVSFEIQRSGNGSSWQTIAVALAAGFNSSTNDYSYTDNTPLPSDSWYRIAEVDANGSKNFSQVKKLQPCNKEENSLKASPNPCSGTLQLQAYCLNNTQTTFIIHAADGKQVFSKTVALIKGANHLSWDIQQLSSGNYFISCDTHVFETIKIVKR